MGAITFNPDNPETWGVLRLSKLETARRQLDTAIALFFEDRDPVAIHTLAAAAHQVLHDLCLKSGLEPTLRNPKSLDEETRKKYFLGLTTPENYFKHADRDSDKSLLFVTETTQFMMFDATSLYFNLAKSITREMQTIFFYCTKKYSWIASMPSLETTLRDLPALDDKGAWRWLMNNIAETVANPVD